MMLIRLSGVCLGYGGPPLLDEVHLTLRKGDRVCVIGRNGVGKSTLLRLIAGEIEADQGVREVRRSVRIAWLEQEIPAGSSGRVFELVAEGLGELSGLVRQYHAASLDLASSGSAGSLRKLAGLQQALESAGGWQMEQQVERVISRLALDPDAEFDKLSGGLQRRVLLARALGREPDLLLLDEPTNHLDLESIEWLEQFLLAFDGALVFVTHDRTFLGKVANRIVELDRGSLTDWPGDYGNFLRRKEEMLSSEARENDRFDKKLAQEEVWIRQGIKARRTRNEGRVRALQQMRADRRRRRDVEGKARLGLVEADRSGKLVIEANAVSYGWQGNPVVRDFSTIILRGDKVGVIGKNGAGKTTLLNLLLGKLSPDSGQVRLGTGLQVAYFDQHRTPLDPQKTLLENITDEIESPATAGGTRNVIGYLKDFLFTPERMRMPVEALSGGEKNRLLLARLFAKPANVLVMDEPTNDLDLETLELLEELLVEYRGTLLLVSHDRSFLNNVVTSCLAFEGEGRISEYVGGYDDWLAQRSEDAGGPTGEEPKQVKPHDRTPAGSDKRAGKLSFNEQRELDVLPRTIESLEQEQTEIREKMSDPAFFRQDGGLIADTNQRLAELDEALEKAYLRWEELEAPRDRPPAAKS